MSVATYGVDAKWDIVDALRIGATSLANATKLSVFGGNAALWEITLATCLIIVVKLPPQIYLQGAQNFKTSFG